MARIGLDPNLVISVTDAAKMLNCNRATVHRWIKEGKLSALTVGRMNLLSRAEVLSMVGSDRSEALKRGMGRAIALPADVQVSFEATADPTEFRITYYATSTGQELVGTCHFDQDPTRWLDEAVKRTETKTDRPPVQ